MAVRHQNPNDDRVTEFNNSGHGRLTVPGFGCELETVLRVAKRFRHGIMDASYPRLTAKEVSMLRLMDAITDKPNWKLKVRNPGIIEKWRVEAMRLPFMSDAAFDWCIEEIQDTTDWDDNSVVLTLNTGSRCAKGDNVVPKPIREGLQSQVLPLLQKPKDWHPDSNEQLLDLVHPSLYPLVYGKTRIKPHGIVKLNEVVPSGKTTVVVPSLPEPPRKWPPSGWSYRFQWLPCEVKFREDFGTRVKITSYINNLRPDLHKELYQTIEQVIEYSVPVWNQVLLKSTHGRTSRRIQASELAYEPPLPEWVKGISRHKEDPNWEEDLRKVKEYCQLPEVTISAEVDHGHHQFLHDMARIYQGPEPFDWENPDGKSMWLGGVVAAKHLHLRKVIHPDPGPETYFEWKEKQWDAKTWDFKHRKDEDEPNPYPVRLENEFRNQGLQIIVKLASIELTPQKPEYPGGNWHLEGSLSEHIVATAIYYFDVQNVSESRIRFREAVTLDTRGVWRGKWPDLTDFAEVWGASVQELEYDGAAVQEIGSIKTPQGRLLAFPNTLQHRVEPFRLVDSTKPGHRRFLVLWLVDPNYRIMSTQNVPPQQAEWQSDAALAILRRKRGSKLPPEVLAIIREYLDELAPFLLRKAKKIRKELMTERGVLDRDVDHAALKYSLCEH